MTDKITLNPTASFTDPAAVSTLNTNFATIETALNNTLSRDGTSPNTMLASLDMNSNRILNLPAPGGLLEPIRLTDLNTFSGGGTITVQGIPSGGTSGQILAKTSSTDYQTAWTDAANNLPTGGTAGQILQKTSSANYATGWGDLPSTRYSANAMENASITATVAGNALTIALKAQDGSDPTSGVPCTFAFRNSTISSGTYSIVTATAPTSLTISSGSTLGTSNATAFRIWVVLFNDSGTLRLGAINCRSNTQIYSLNEDVLSSSSAEGGAGAADSVGTFYTNTAVSSKPMRILGYLDWNSGVTTAGTWNTLPSKIQIFGLGVRRPGEIVQTFNNTFAAGSGSSSASTTLVDTNVTGSITLTSPCNSVAYSFSISSTIAVAAAVVYGNLARGGINVSPQFIGAFSPTSSANVVVSHLDGGDFPGSSGPFTYTVRLKNSGTAATFFWNDNNSGSTISLAEVMC